LSPAAVSPHLVRPEIGFVSHEGPWDIGISCVIGAGHRRPFPPSSFLLFHRHRPGQAQGPAPATRRFLPPVCSTEIEKKVEIVSPPGRGTAAGGTAAVARASRGSPTRHFALGTPRPWSTQFFGHVRNWQPCHHGLRSGARTAFQLQRTRPPQRKAISTRISRIHTDSEQPSSDEGRVTTSSRRHTCPRAGGGLRRLSQPGRRPEPRGVEKTAIRLKAKPEFGPQRTQRSQRRAQARGQEVQKGGGPGVLPPDPLPCTPSDLLLSVLQSRDILFFQQAFSASIL